MNDLAFIKPTNADTYTVVDGDRFQELNSHKWRVTPNWYIARYSARKDGKPGSVSIYLHQQVNMTPVGMITHHKNHLPWDNRACNLQTVTKAQNGQHQSVQQRRKSSRYKGVSYHKDCRFCCWSASIKVGGKKKVVGSFDNERDAALAYNAAAKQHYGDFAMLNDVQ